jgi:multidrug resistance efflux pump
MLAVIAALMSLLAAASCEKKSQKSDVLAYSEVVEGSEIPGFVSAANQQAVYPTPGLSWSFTIARMVPEGAEVKVGEVLVKFESEEDQKALMGIDQSIAQTQIEIAGAAGQVSNEIANLTKEISDLENNLSVLKIGMQGSEKNLEWITPARDRIISEMEEKSYRLKLELKRKRLVRLQNLLHATDEAGKKRMEMLAQEKVKIEDIITQNSVKAKQNGIAVYKYLAWSGIKPHQGTTVFAGTSVMSVYSPDEVFVAGYIPESMLQHYAVGRTVAVKTLGVKESSAKGAIESISRSVMKIEDWQLDVPMPKKTGAIRAFKMIVRVKGEEIGIRPDEQVRILALKQEKRS